MTQTDAKAGQHAAAAALADDALRCQPERDQAAPAPRPDPCHDTDASPGPGVTVPVPAASLAATNAAALDAVRRHVSCGICSNLVASSLVLSCGHTFCGTCLFAFLNERPSCPTCQVGLRAIPVRCLALDGVVAALARVLSASEHDAYNARAEDGKLVVNHLNKALWWLQPSAIPALSEPQHAASGGEGGGSGGAGGGAGSGGGGMTGPAPTGGYLMQCGQPRMQVQGSGGPAAAASRVRAMSQPGTAQAAQRQQQAQQQQQLPMRQSLDSHVQAPTLLPLGSGPAMLPTHGGQQHQQQLLSGFCSDGVSGSSSGGGFPPRSLGMFDCLQQQQQQQQVQQQQVQQPLHQMGDFPPGAATRAATSAFQQQQEQLRQFYGTTQPTTANAAGLMGPGMGPTGTPRGMPVASMPAVGGYGVIGGGGVSPYGQTLMPQGGMHSGPPASLQVQQNMEGMGQLAAMNMLQQQQQQAFLNYAAAANIQQQQQQQQQQQSGLQQRRSSLYMDYVPLQQQHEQPVGAGGMPGGVGAQQGLHGSLQAQVQLQQLLSALSMTDWST